MDEPNQVALLESAEMITPEWRNYIRLAQEFQRSLNDIVDLRNRGFECDSLPVNAEVIRGRRLWMWLQKVQRHLLN